MKIDWKRKLSSRKLWALVATFVTALLILFKADAETIEQVTAMIVAGGAVVAYIFAESKVDAAAVDKEKMFDENQ